jgi:hypothetical protein
MSAPRIIRSGERRLLGASLVLICLTAAAVNVPFAVTKVRSRTGTVQSRTTDVRGAAAGPLGWPSSVPHDQGWPDPTYHITRRAFGYREYEVNTPSTTDGENGYSMAVQHLGWPLPVLEMKQMWWNWNDPALKGPEPDPRPSLMALGLVANPLLVGVPVWGAVVVLPVAVLVFRRAGRLRRGDCPWCGYELAAGQMCPECGPQPGP